jgi:hypothetical protein
MPGCERGGNGAGGSVEFDDPLVGFDLTSDLGVMVTPSETWLMGGSGDEEGRGGQCQEEVGKLNHGVCGRFAICI